MPHTHMAKKPRPAVRQATVRNRAVKKAIKIHIKTVFDAAKSNPDKLDAEIKAAIKKLDKAAAKRVIHPNTAARRKSQPRGSPTPRRQAADAGSPRSQVGTSWHVSHGAYRVAIISWLSSLVGQRDSDHIPCAPVTTEEHAQSSQIEHFSH